MLFRTQGILYFLAPRFFQRRMDDREEVESILTMESEGLSSYSGSDTTALGRSRSLSEPQCSDL